MKVLTIRIDDDFAEQLDAVARVNQRPTSEEVRAALHHHVRGMMADEAFRSRLRESIQRNQEILASLGEEA